MAQLQPYRWMQVAFAAAFVLLASAFLGGCRTAPQLSVVDHRLGAATAEAQRVEFVVNMTNPGDEPVELRELRYRVRIDGRHVYDGRRAAQATLQPGETLQVVMPAVIAIDELAANVPLERYHVSGSLSYIRPGVIERMLRDMGMPRPRVGFSDDGAVSWRHGG